MKKYYIYIRGIGIVEREFNHKETTTDILMTLIGDYGENFMSYEHDYISACKLMLDEIYYETYKI